MYGIFVALGVMALHVLKFFFLSIGLVTFFANFFRETDNITSFFVGIGFLVLYLVASKMIEGGNEILEQLEKKEIVRN